MYNYNVIVLPEDTEKENIEMVDGKFSLRQHKIEALRKKVFGDCYHVGQITTPYRLVEQMYDKLPDLNEKKIFIWYNPEVYAIGKSRYPEARFTIITGSKSATTFKIKNVDEILYIDHTEEGINSLCSLFMERDMKFDVVIGNPPYQDNNGRSASHGQLWDKFVKKSIELCKEGGYVALIHPPAWRKPDHKIYKIFQQKKLKYLSIHTIEDGMKTFKCSTRYDWYVLQNTLEDGITEIRDENGQMLQVNLKDFPFLPNGNFELFEKIIAKEGEETCVPIYSRSKYGSDKKWMSKVETEEFKYPCVYMMTKGTPLKLMYSKTNKSGHFGISKVIINKQGATLCCLNDHEGKYGITEWGFGIEISSKEEGEKIIKALKSDKFKKIWESTSWLTMTREWKVFKSFKKDFWKEFV